MRILFMGTPDFALPTLRALCENGHEVVGAVTQPDKPKGRGHHMTPPPIKVYAMEKNIPVYAVEGNTVHVTVGSVEHPMTTEHYIEWVCLETEHGIQYAHLDSDDKPKAKFSICDGDEVRAVYAFCNQHDLWRK